jgi:Rrf2 family nitric oxide-sensitive transcriptional repressor
MRLTAFTDYTLRTLTYLALRPQKLVTIAEVATAYGVSANHLMKVVHSLAQSGDVATLRGQHGGLRLARAPQEINLGTVVRRTEPDLELAFCFGSGPWCRIKGECGVSDVLAEALGAFLAVLDRYTLADLVAKRRDSLMTLLGIAGPAQPVAAALPSATEMA